MMRVQSKVLVLAALVALIFDIAAVAGVNAQGTEGQAHGTPPAADAAPQRDGPGRQALAACRADMQTLCGAIEAGGGRRIACLGQNQDKLSPDCKAAVLAILVKSGHAQPPAESTAQAPAAGRAGGFGQVCKADIASVCAGIEKGEGRIAKCLKENSAKLSPSCQGFFAARQADKKAARQDVKAQCAGDAATVCGAGVKGQPLVACLRQAVGKVSPGCQQALTKLN